MDFRDDDSSGPHRNMSGFLPHFCLLQKLVHIHVRIVDGVFVSECPLQKKWAKTTLKNFEETVTQVITGLSRPNW